MPHRPFSAWWTPARRSVATVALVSLLAGLPAASRTAALPLAEVAAQGQRFGALAGREAAARDSVAVRSTEAAVSQEGAELVQNGSFETSGTSWLAPWRLLVRSGAAASIGQDTLVDNYRTGAGTLRSARVRVEQAASNAPWLVQVQQSGLRLLAGQRYTLSFWAKASTARKVEVVLQQNVAPYTVYANRVVGLSTSWQRFTLSYTAAADVPDAFVGFNLAQTSGEVWLDVVSLSTDPAPLPVAGQDKGVAWRHPAQYWKSKLSGIDSDYADMRAGNITWARVDLYYTQNPDGTFDKLVQKAREQGIKLLIVVHKPSPLKDLGTEADRALYRSWLAQMVDRYRYHVKHWEIMNEPNLHYEWNIDESIGSDQAAFEDAVSRYVLHLKDGYETIKAHDPAATVLIGGLSEWLIMRYMDALLKTEAHRYFDVMSYHPYGKDPDRVMERFYVLNDKLSLNMNYRRKPIWVTEIGFNTSWSNKAGYVTSEQRKADYLGQAMRRLHGAGAQLPIFWYTLHENENASGYGLLSKDPTTLKSVYYPAFFRYRDLAY